MPVILIGLGGNLDSSRFGPPRQTLAAAIAELQAEGIKIMARSQWYRSEPVPRSDQPWFINAVASLDSEFDARTLLAMLHDVEKRFGRVRGEPNASRVVDLDLLDYRGEVSHSPSLMLPHPRLHQRRFVLVPLAEIAPHWRHPVLGLTVGQLLAHLTADQQLERLSC
ncbi:MAG: 2-amino-4-hydroxy-6-hydroxymethyldihydropteridine diphosphokinase [Stellaceae bacterium]